MHHVEGTIVDSKMLRKQFTELQSFQQWLFRIVEVSNPECRAIIVMCVVVCSYS